MATKPAASATATVPEMKSAADLITALRRLVSVECVNHDAGARTLLEQLLALVPTTDPKTGEILLLYGSTLLGVSEVKLGIMVLKRAVDIFKASASYNKAPIYASTLLTLSRALREDNSATTEAGPLETEAQQVFEASLTPRPAASSSAGGSGTTT